jgi:glycosyltransferase involved in cell wall biosynthesis
MRVLYITAEVPWPLQSGYLRHFHIMRGLSERHDVTLLSLTRREGLSEEAASVLRSFLDGIEVVPHQEPGRRSRMGKAERVLARRRAARRLAARVRERLATDRHDVVLFSGKDTFPALQAVGRTPVVVDVCDAASLRIRGQLDVAGPARRPALGARLAEVRRVERRLADATPHLLFASERDRDAVLGADDGGRVVPNAVDLDYWTRSTRPEPAAAAPRIVMTGVMDYPPNHDAAMRLAERIMPQVRDAVPDAELVIAGRDPAPELRAAADAHPWMTVTGALPDLRPEMERSAVYCAPLRFASGIQNKLLEALAMEVPVVTTPVVADGVRAEGINPPMIIADADEAIASGILRLLRTPADHRRLAAEGRAFVEDAFSWPRTVATVESELAAAAGGPPGAALHPMAAFTTMAGVAS